jgi:hypothetical protein
MKAKRRQELQTNQLADWLGNKIELIKPYATWIAGGLALLIVFGIVYSWRVSRQGERLANAWDLYDSAQRDGFAGLRQREELKTTDALRRLEEVAIRYESLPVGLYAMAAMGDIYLEMGSNDIESNRNAARDHFKKAAQQYETIVNGNPSPMLKNHALFCLAKSYEWQMKINQAKQYYAQVQGPFHDEAQARVRDLDRKATQDFYEKFAEWKPKPPADASAQPGGADQRYPGFELDEDSPAEVDYQGYLDATAAGLDVINEATAPETTDSAPSAEPKSADGSEASDVEPAPTNNGGDAAKE